MISHRTRGFRANTSTGAARRYIRAVRWVALCSTIAAVAVSSAALLLGCACQGDDSADTDEQRVDLSKIGPVSPDGPKLASIDKLTEIRDKPGPDSNVIGTMRAGALVARAPEPIGKDHCPGGWYPIYPRGFVCAGPSATINLSHPTLAVMKTLPALDAPLPYLYYTTKRTTPIYAWQRAGNSSVREVGKLRARSRVAVVGSWQTELPKKGTVALSMLTDGRFVTTEHLQESSISSFQGVKLDDKAQLPVAFILKQGVRSFQLDGKSATRDDALSPHTMLLLTGKFRTISDMRFWATSDGRWVRHADITMLRRRDKYPEFAQGTQKWADISIVTGTMVLYEGKKPVYATLCSVGQDRFGNPETSASTQMGTFALTGKYVTTSTAGTKPFADDLDVLDVPWAHTMESGQMIHGATWHNRFGIEHGPGNIQLSPVDAAYLFRWAGPDLPEGWHSINKYQEQDPKVLINIRK